MALEQLEWYRPKIHVHVAVDESRITRSPLGNEMSVYFSLGDNLQEYYVIVPTWAWNEDTSTIPALQVGEITDQDSVLVSFPSTSLGTYTLGIPKADVKHLLDPTPILVAQ